MEAFDLCHKPTIKHLFRLEPPKLETKMLFKTDEERKKRAKNVSEHHHHHQATPAKSTREKREDRLILARAITQKVIVNILFPEAGRKREKERERERERRENLSHSCDFFL